MGKREVTEVGGNHVRLKDESNWIKIPDHHPGIISRELFQQVQKQMVRFKAPKKKTRCYALRGKVFCGCCQHALTRTSKKLPTFHCRHTQVDKTAACHGLVITEIELENLLYEILSKQAQIILNLDNIADISLLDVQLARQAQYSEKITECMEEKRALYEQFLLQKISAEEYKAQKAIIDGELSRLKQLQSVVSAQTARMQMDEKATKRYSVTLLKNLHYPTSASQLKISRKHIT